MRQRDTSWQRGYAAAQRDGAAVATVDIPLIYSMDQKCRFLAGFLIGAKERLELDVNDREERVKF